MTWSKKIINCGHNIAITCAQNTNSRPQNTNLWPRNKYNVFCGHEVVFCAHVIAILWPRLNACSSYMVIVFLKKKVDNGRYACLEASKQ